MVPYFNEISYKTDAFGEEGEIVGRQKITVQLFTNGKKIFVREIRCLAVLPKYAPSRARKYKGYSHFQTVMDLTEERVFQMAKFMCEMPKLCKECGEGFQVLQRPGKYSCTNCEA